MVLYGWFECANEDCSLRSHLSDDYDVSYRTFYTWMPIGEHRVFLVARTDAGPNSEYVTSEMITITVTATGETPTPTATVSPTATATATASPTPTETATPSPTPTVTPSPSPTETATPTPSPTVTATPTPTATATPAPSPRLRVAPAAVVPGQSVTVSVSGFGARESVRVRWLIGTRWTDVGTITTGADGTGSAQVVVPNNASAGANKIRGDSPTAAAQTGTINVSIPGPASGSLSANRGTVNSKVGFSLSNFTPSATVTITWKRPGGSAVEVGSTTISSDGAGAGSFPVPATTGGISTVTFSDGTKSATVQFEVAPRIKVTPSPVAPGDTVDVSLRGYGKKESVRIRWLVDGQWVTVATVTTSNTGSANVSVTVPENASEGSNSVRGDGTTYRQQTNAVMVVP
jgi:hypothetical protein